MCVSVLLAKPCFPFSSVSSDPYNHTTTSGYLDNTNLPVVCISFRFDSFVPLCLSFLRPPPPNPFATAVCCLICRVRTQQRLREDTQAHPYHTTPKLCVYLVHNDDDKVAYFVCFFFISSSINSTDWMKTRVQHLKMKRKPLL